MAAFYILGKLAEHPRGKRLQKFLSATVSMEVPEGTGLGIISGQDYQTRTPAEQRKWLAWAARPGCVLLLVPPFQTAARHEPNNWELGRLDVPPTFDPGVHPVLRLTLPEMTVCIVRGLNPTLDPMIDGGARPPLSGIYRKHPDSGIFAVSAVPIWSIALSDNVAALTEWLNAWVALAGRAIDNEPTTAPVTFEPTQRHFSILLYLAAGHFSSQAAAIEGLAWNDTFEFHDVDAASLLDDLLAAGLIADGALTEAGRRTLLESPYRLYAEAFLNPSSSL